MKKSLLISSTFLFLILGCNNTTVQPQKEITFVGSTQGSCDTTDLKTQATPDCATISSKFDGNNLKVTVKQRGFCNSSFKLSSNILADKIVLNADDTSTEGTRCFCYYNLEYNFSNAAKSSYNIEYSGKVYNNDPCPATATVKK